MLMDCPGIGSGTVAGGALEAHRASGGLSPKPRTIRVLGFLRVIPKLTGVNPNLAFFTGFAGAVWSAYEWREWPDCDNHYMG